MSSFFSIPFSLKVDHNLSSNWVGRYHMNACYHEVRIVPFVWRIGILAVTPSKLRGLSILVKTRSLDGTW